MSPSSKNVANAVGGKTARACDSCITKRARWYCAADDAFLCQACDSSVHSANPLARRHQRLRLKTATLDPLNTTSTCAPTWHHGFTKKARTPRNGGKTNHSSSSTRPTSKSCWSSRINNQQPFHLVPEEGEGSDEVNSHEDNEEQLLYRVPVFDPFVAELCSPAENNNKKESEESKGSFGSHLHGFLPSEADLAEFAADVESLLGRGMENECVGMEHLGLIDNNNNNKVVKVEMEQEQEHMDATCSSCKLEEGDNHMMMMEIGRETAFQFSFDYDESHETEEIDKEKVKDDDEDAINKKRKILLQLDYEGVINAWGGSHKSPWTTGHKPNLDLHDCWPHTMATGGTELHHGYGELMIGLGCNPSSVILGDGGREARVSRYREKRRTRLFSKKIRYEVRKLNAEKRPRMKGRFVKRASFAAPFPLIA